MANEDIVISKRTIFLLVSVVIALLVGYFLGSLPYNPTECPTCQTAGLTEEDKTFIDATAKAQLQLSDWCIASGGFWNQLMDEGTIPVGQEAADNIRQGGGIVTEVNGTLYASVTLIDRAGCIFINT